MLHENLNARYNGNRIKRCRTRDCADTVVLDSTIADFIVQLSKRFAFVLVDRAFAGIFHINGPDERAAQSQCELD